MPKVFAIKIKINQFLWLFFADFHKAIPFQTNAQTANAKNNNIYEGLDNNSKNFNVSGSIILEFRK